MLFNSLYKFLQENFGYINFARSLVYTDDDDDDVDLDGSCDDTPDHIGLSDQVELC